MSWISSLLGADAVSVPQFSNAQWTQQAHEQQQQAILQQQALAQALANNQGLAAQNQAIQGYGDIAAGRGPNVAQAMLNQATGANVANQAALMAGQRGAAGNVGLMARQIAQQGAQTQQQAGQQAALLQAQQQQSALSGLANVGQQQIGNQMQATGILGQAAQNAYNTQAQQQEAQAQMQLQANMAAQQAQQRYISGALQGAGAYMGYSALPSTTPQSMPQYDTYNNPSPELQQRRGFADGGEVKPDHIKHMDYLYHGGQTYAAKGGEIPGKPEVEGDSIKNDKVKAMLSPGEIVIPRSIAQGENAGEEAKKFVEAILKKGNEHGDFKEALKSAIKARKK